MLKSGRSIRFTATEINELAELGIDIDGVKSADDFTAALEPWLQALAQARPDLFHKIAGKIASAKSRMGSMVSGPRSS